MSIATEINDYETYLKNAYDKCEEKEATIPNKKTLQNLTSTIESIKDNVKVYTVTFDSDGGTEVSSQVVISGNPAVEPISPEKDEYIFKNWALNGVEYDFSTPVTSDITLVAVWESTKPYIELEYLKSTGTQYIDTGVVLNSNIKIEDWITADTSYGGLNGSDGTGTNFRFKYGFNNSFYIGYAANNYLIESSTKPIDSNTFYKFTIAKGVQKIEPEVFTYSNTSILSSYPTKSILLFALRENSGNINYCSSLKRKECKIYNGTTLIRDFIPVIRKSDNVAMMYDLVNSEFYPNVGTGSFTAGAIKQ